MNNKRKLYGFILGILMFMVLITSLSYAYYSWKSSEEGVSFSISDSYFYCESGSTTTVSGLSPVLDYRASGRYYQGFMVNNIGRSDTTFSISLNISSIDDSLISDSLKYKIMVDKTGDSENDICASTSDTSCEEVASGDFSSAKVGMNTLAETVTLPNNVRYRYYLFIYIDGNMPNDEAMQNSTMVATLDVCEVAVFFDYNGGSGPLEFLKVTSTYAGLPTATKNPLTIKYNSNNGTSVSSSSITFSFDGWYLEDDNPTTKITDSTKVTKTTNHTLYANWIPSPTSGVTLGTTTRTGYTFTGWYRDGTLIGQNGDSYLPEYENELTEITLDAGWEQHNYTYSFECNGGTCPSSATVGYDDVINLTATKKVTVTGNVNGTGASIGAATSANQTFAGWSSGTANGLNTSTAKRGTTTSPTTSWDGSKTTNTYFKNLTPTNNGTVKLTANWTPVAITLPTVTKTGYTCGWNESSTGGTIQYASGGTYTPGASDGQAKTMYAVCEANKVTVTINKDGSAWSDSGMNIALYSGTTSAYAYSTATIGTSTVVWSGVTAGTYNVYAGKNSGAKTTLVDTNIDVVVKTGSTVAPSVSAAINYYTLTLTPGTGISSVNGAATYLNNQTASISATASTGYTFSSWTVNSGNTPASTSATSTTVSMSKATSLTANATANTATITIKKDGSAWSSSGINVALYSGTTSAYAYSAGTASGSTVKWSVVADGTYNIYAGKNSGAVTSLVDTGVDITVSSTGSATINYYTLSLTAGTGISSVSGAATYLNNQTATIIASVSTGYTFGSWSGTGNTPASTTSATTTVSASTTTSLTATGTPNKYTIAYKLNGGTLGEKAPTSGTYDQDAVISNATKTITVTGYTNSTSGANGTGVTIGPAKSTSSSFTGWTSSTSDGLNTSTAKYGTAAAPTTAWTGALTKYVYFRNLTPTNGATVTMTANWSAATIALPKVTKSGYTCGWNTSSSGTTIQYASESNYTLSTTVAAAVPMYAVCKPNTVTVNINQNGSAWSGSGMNVALYSGTTSTYAYSTGTANGSSVTWSGVAAGTYNIYASESSNNKTTLKDTGVDVTITNGTTAAGSATATINYYTLTLTAGTGITSVSGAATYLSTVTAASISTTVTSGYTFSSWTVNSGNTPASTTATSTTVSMSKATSLTANAIANTATVTITKDGTAWSGSGMNVALYSGTTLKYAYSAGTASGSTVKWSVVASGTYNVYAAASSSNTTLTDTGVDIVVTTTGSATINYSSLTGTFKYYNNQSTTVSCYKLSTVSSCNITASAALGTPTGYTFRGWSTSTSGSATISVAAGGTAALSANTTYYASYQMTVTATFYYSPLASTDYTYTTTASTTTASGTRYMGYTGTIINTQLTIPTAVTGSSGGAAASNYKGVSNSTSSASTLSIANITTATTNYYAVYDESLTFYYYNGSSHTNTAMTRRMLYNGTNYTLSLSASVPTPSAYDGASFSSWSYTTDSINTRKPLETGVNDLYAVYQKSYTITYNANGGSGAPSNQTATKSYISKSGGITEFAASATISSTTPTRTNYNFTGWNTSSDGSGTSYTVGSTYNITSNLTLYAQWVLATYYFDLNIYLDGTVTNSSTLTAGLKVDGVDKGYVSDYYTKHTPGTKWEIYGVKVSSSTIAYTASGTVGSANTSHNINFYTLKINASGYGTVSPTSMYVLKGTSYSASGSTITLNSSIDGRKITATPTAATGYTTVFSSWSPTSGTITGAATITANFTRSRTFFCGAAGNSATYAGKSWTVLANDGTWCTLALNSQSNATGTYNAATTNLTTAFFTSTGSDYSATMTSEKNAGLLAAVNGTSYIDTNGGTTNAPTGVYWTGSGAYYDSSSSSRKKYTCNNYKLYKGSDLSDTDDSNRGLAGTSFCTSVSSAAGSGAVSNASANLTYTNGTYTSAAIEKLNSADLDAKFSFYHSNWVWKSGSTSTVAATLTVYNTYSVDTGKWSETTKYSRSNKRFYLYACGGKSGNSYAYRITANSSSSCYVKNNITGTAEYTKSFSKDLQTDVSGYSTRTETDGYWYYYNNKAEFDCSTRTKYTVSNLNIALHYRPRIKVKI